MVDISKLDGDDVRGLFLKKPEILGKIMGITINKDTVKFEHWIATNPGRARIDFVFEDTAGKHYTVKVAYKEKLLNAIRHPNVWQWRWAEMNKLPIDNVVPVLVIEEDAVVNADPRSKEMLKSFDDTTLVVYQYKIEDIAKEIEA
ncbi:MAG: hypothetical protein ABIJ37_11100 [Pseudomonadota bacterium]